MKETKEINSFLVDGLNQVNKTKLDLDLDFLSNVIHAYLDANSAVTLTDLYGFSRMCIDISEQLKQCELTLEKIHSISKSKSKI